MEHRKKIDKISVIDPVGGHGGMEYYDYGLCLGLKAARCEPYYFTCNDTKPLKEEEIITHFVFGNIWQKSKLGKLLYLILGYLKAFIISKRNKIQVVHFQLFHLGFQNVMVLWIAKNMFGLNIVVTLHDIDSFRGHNSSWLQKRAFNLVDEFIVHNKFSYQQLVAKLNNGNNVSIVPHGDYLNFVSCLPYSSKLNSKFKLLFFGQIKEVKGLEVLLKAIHILNKNISDVSLTIAGKPWGTDKEKYLNLIDEYKLKNNIVTNFNYIPNEEVASYFKACDLVVLPYKKIYQSGVLLLTMSYGRAALCSDLDAFKEIIEDNKSGYLFKSEDEQDLANKLLEIYKNKSNIAVVRDNANQLLKTTYNWNTIGALTKTIYDKY